ncbi:hypothetical protein V1264_002785 [Littorina saxatilis]|uniref:Uncharacterized protein n=2 Tax=Littorina saxatilis TaxID=31220 RepID=A0AAN9B4P1_9CAEN
MDFSPDTASMRSFDEARNQMDKEKAKFTLQLKDFPHTFQLENEDSTKDSISNISSNQIKRCHSSLKSALDVGYKTDLETARGRNLLAYLLHRLDREEEALEELDMVLDMEGQHNNLVTLTNKAVILWRQHSISSADEVVETLQKIQASNEDFEYLVVKAKAELAFTYTRLGPRFGPQAVSFFNEVIPKARPKEPEEWLWRFGLALTRRRLLRTRPMASTPIPSTEIVHEEREVLELLMEIAKNCSCRNLQAKTYAEIALLLNGVWKTPDCGDFYKRAGVNLVEACEKALSLDSNDNSVLCKCGRLFRYARRSEDAQKLLEKAVSIRPSGTGYHHLGLTYKCLATDVKYKDVKKIPGYFRELSRQHSETKCRNDEGHTSSPTDKNCSNQCDLDEKFSQMSVGTPVSSLSSSGYHSFPSGASTDAKNVPAATESQNSSDVSFPDSMNVRQGPVDTPKFSLNRDVRVMQRVVKSPPAGVTRFTRDDKYVMEALHNLERAVEVSEGENTAAMYDLAILQKALNELPAAKKTLQKCLKNQHNMRHTDQISAFEQMGLVTKEMAESEKNEDVKQRLLKDSNSMLLMALKTSAMVFSKSPGMEEKFGKVWHSFSTLLQSVEQSKKNQHQKLKEKAKLFQLIKDHKQTLNLLKQIAQMDPGKEQDPEYLKLCIVEYVDTKQFEDALAFIELLEIIHPDTMQLFEDKHFELKIYMQAARQALLGNDLIAKPHFMSVFQLAVVVNAEKPSSSEDTDASDDTRRGEETWDVTILHEESSREKAIAMAEILRTFCGLRVPIMDRDLPPNRIELESVLRIMRRSKLVVVMAGGPVSIELRYYIQYAAKRPSTVTLLVDGKHVPEMLKRHRSMTCPEEVFTLSDQSQEKKVSAVDALCKVFGFMVMDPLEVDIAST